MRTINTRWFATVVPATLGFGFAALCIRVFEFYGWSLFLGVPVAVSFLSAFCVSLNREASEVSFWSAYGTSVVSLLCLGGFILIVALDGLLCLIMAFPLALVLAFVGAGLGYSLGCARENRRPSYYPALLVLFCPGLIGLDLAAAPREPPMRCVTTSVVVSVPIEKVWTTVIAFPKITDPPSGIFRLGIAYPIEAHIEGAGVGAVRQCVFSTGNFVEPITRWEEPVLLEFDVAELPPPMKEISFYEHVNAPHLHGQMISHRGRFRLSKISGQGERDGQVLLEGTTWYTHTLSPQWYWGPISDYMIHRIHERVLNQIKRTSEGA